MTLRRPRSKSLEGGTRLSKMRLHLMRHGIAIDREDPKSPEEAQRYLTPKGIERTRSAAGGLVHLGVKATGLLTSPYLRAVQTGEIVCDVLGMDPKQLCVTDALKPDAEPALLIEDLQRLSKDEVICFGHAPHLDEFIAYAVRAGSAFTALKKAGVACLDLETLSPLRATLAWLLTSRVLRNLGH